MESSFSGELIKRRVPHLLGIFLGAAWVGVEFTDWIVERYGLSNNIVDMVLAGLLTLTPAVAIVAWFHGRPGRDAWHPVERVAVPLNVLFAAVLVGLIGGGGNEVQAQVQTVTATDEEGREVVRQVVDRSLKQSLAVFFFDNESADDNYDWLQYGANIALSTDLEQNPFFSVHSPFTGWEQYGFFHMRRAGYADGIGIPLALKRDIARKWKRDYFISGAFEHVEGRFLFTVDLYETESGRKLANYAVEGEDHLALMDEITQLIVGELGLPDPSQLPDAVATIEDLPVEERLTSNEEAFRAFVEARMGMNIGNDRAGALSAYERAIELDPSFAAANSEYAFNVFSFGDSAKAAPAIQRALQHDYRLLDRQRFSAKALDYVLRGERDKELAVYRMWSELAPYDANAHATLGFNLLYTYNDIEGALASFERAYEVAPGENWLLARMAQLKELTGEADAAISYYRKAAAEDPEDHGMLMALGYVLRRQGELEEARRNFERAALLGTGFVDPVIAQANLDLREGRFDSALARLQEAENIAATPRQRAGVLRARIYHHGMRGEAAVAVSLLSQLDAAEAEYRTDINRVIGVWVDHAEQYGYAGQLDAGLAKLDSLRGELPPPYDALLHVGYYTINLAIGDADAAEEHGTIVEDFMHNFKRDDMLYALRFGRAQIASLRGDFAAAVPEMENALSTYTQSVQSIENEAEEHLLRSELARLLLEVERYDDAQVQLDAMQAMFPSHAGANVALAKLRLAQDDADGAAAAAAVAAATLANADPTHPILIKLTDLQGRLAP